MLLLLFTVMFKLVSICLVQDPSACVLGPFHTFPLFLEHFLTNWPYKLFQAHLVPSLFQPWHQPLHQGPLLSFSEERCLEAKFWCEMCSLQLKGCLCRWKELGTLCVCACVWREMYIYVNLYLWVAIYAFTYEFTPIPWILVQHLSSLPLFHVCNSLFWQWEIQQPVFLTIILYCLPPGLKEKEETWTEQQKNWDSV